MLISTQTHSFACAYGEAEGLKRLREAGFEAVDYSLFTTENGIYEGPDYLEQAAKIKAVGDSLDLFFGQVHAPMMEYTTDAAVMQKNTQTWLRSIEIAGVLGAPYIVIHPLIMRENRNGCLAQENVELTVNFFRSLIPALEKANTRLGVENMFNWDPLRQRICTTICSTWQEMAQVVDACGDRFVNCLDIGHGLLTNDTPGHMARMLGKRVKLLHVQDVDGQHDLHTLPFLSKVDWPDTVAALREIGYDGTFSLETGAFFSGFPVELYPAAARLMAQTARYLADQVTK